MKTQGEIRNQLDRAIAPQMNCVDFHTWRLVNLLATELATIIAEPDHEARLPAQPRADGPTMAERDAALTCADHPLHLKGTCPHHENNAPCYCKLPFRTPQPAPAAINDRSARMNPPAASEPAKMARLERLCAEGFAQRGGSKAHFDQYIEAARADLADAVAAATRADKERIAELEGWKASAMATIAKCNDAVALAKTAGEMQARHVAELEAKLAKMGEPLTEQELDAVLAAWARTPCESIRNERVTLARMAAEAQRRKGA